MSASSEAHFDDYEHYNYDQDSSVYSAGKSGGKRSKAASNAHKNHHDPSGHTRKIVTKLQNTEKNQKIKGQSEKPQAQQEETE